MAQTYCGKSCLDCTRKEALTCPGCKAGPGNDRDGTCKLAACCREKGHAVCGACGFHSTCGKWLRRDGVPESRMARLEAEAKRRAKMAASAAVLGKWLWLLFWLFIPGELAALMINDRVAGALPALRIPGQILNIVCMAAYALILLKLSSEDDNYRTAGICGLVGAALAAVAGLFGDAPWTLALRIPAFIAALLGEHSEYAGHGQVLWGFDEELSQKWSRLWRWYIRSMVIMLVSAFATLILWRLAILGLLVMIAALIFMMVVAVLKLVYLCRMAKIFRTYAARETA